MTTTGWDQVPASAAPGAAPVRCRMCGAEVLAGREACPLGHRLPSPAGQPAQQTMAPGGHGAGWLPSGSGFADAAPSRQGSPRRRRWLVAVVVAVPLLAVCAVVAFVLLSRQAGEEVAIRSTTAEARSDGGAPQPEDGPAPPTAAGSGASQAILWEVVIEDEAGLPPGQPGPSLWVKEGCDASGVACRVHDSGVGDYCRGDTVLDDMREGAFWTLLDDAGASLATGRLPEGSTTDAGRPGSCTFSVETADVRSAPDYTLRLAGRDMSATSDAIRRAGGAARVTLTVTTLTETVADMPELQGSGAAAEGFAAAFCNWMATPGQRGPEPFVVYTVAASHEWAYPGFGRDLAPGPDGEFHEGLFNALVVLEGVLQGHVGADPAQPDTWLDTDREGEILIGLARSMLSTRCPSDAWSRGWVPPQPTGDPSTDFLAQLRARGLTAPDHVFLVLGEGACTSLDYLQPEARWEVEASVRGSARPGDDPAAIDRMIVIYEVAAATLCPQWQHLYQDS